MNVTITVNMDNAAFGDTAEDQKDELSRILTTAMDKFNGSDDVTLRDFNGNVVGKLTVTE